MFFDIHIYDGDEITVNSDQICFVRDTDSF